MKDFTADNMKNAGLYGYVYGFSADQDSIDVDNILDIHKYLMKNHDIMQCFNLTNVYWIIKF